MSLKMNNLTNGNVSLREFIPEDKYRMVELANNPKISVNLRDGFPNPYTLADAENFIEKYARLDSSQKLLLKTERFTMNSGMQKLKQNNLCLALTVVEKPKLNAISIFLVQIHR